MSGELATRGEEFLPARVFVKEILDKLGVESVNELSLRDKMRIALAFQLDQCEKDIVERLPAIGLDPEEDQGHLAMLHLCGRGGEMLTLVQILIGYEGDMGFDLDF